MKANPNYKIQLQNNTYTELDFSESIKQLKVGTTDEYVKGDQEMAGKILINCDSCKIKIED